ncbi:MAG: diguanylate cyclase [Candidatus Omnitrophica bacterium]|nr:diguanylate cyclase [Candidatus Omnitrophota bacterium]
MKDKKKNKEFLKGKKFFEGIKFWQKQIAGFEILKSSLKRSKAEAKKFPQKLHNQVEIRTAAERMIIKQLHQEIEQRKKAERLTHDARNYAESIVDTVREPLLVLDVDLRVISASRSFYQIFKVKREETERQYIYDLGNRQWDIPQLRELLEDILPQATSFDGFEVEHNFPDIGKRIMLLNARKIYREASHTQLILLAIEDITERRELEEKLKTLASHDELTGCVNFRSTMELLEKEIVRSQRYQKQFSIIMIDIDDFKSKNDEYGHQAGNDALVAFATVIKNSLRSIDSVGRYGGEEFIVILPETDAQHALAVMERIKYNLEHTKITSPHLENAKEVTLKFSAGIASFPHNAKDLKELIWAADNALLQAKREGKNRAVLERRKLIRLSSKPGTRIEIVDPSGKENVKALKIANISKEGMLFLSTQDILGEEFLCRIYRPKDESPFELICKVKHKQKSENELYRVGVYFPDMPESGKEKLSQCIESPE